MLKRLISKIWNQWARIEHENVGFDNQHVQNWIHEENARTGTRKKKKQFHGKNDSVQ